MMYKKAVLFKNQTTVEKILLTDDAAKIKSLGRTVCNFDDKVWAKEREGIVCKGVREKFRQNPVLAEKLFLVPQRKRNFIQKLNCNCRIMRRKFAIRRRKNSNGSF